MQQQMDVEHKPYLGRCEYCDFTLFSTAEDVRSAEDFEDIKVGAAYRLPQGVYGRCPLRHKVFRLRQIQGTYSKVHKCDSRCLNAKGWDCTCSCGGANHGRGHIGVMHEGGEIEERFLGEPEKWIRGTAKVGEKKDTDRTVLYVFLTSDLSARIKWFVPHQYDPGFEVGQEVSFRAKVRKHEDNVRYGKATIVTMLQEV